MKLNFYNDSTEANNHSFARRKKEQDVVRITVAIKLSLEELNDERRAPFMALVSLARAHTSLLKPVPSHGTPGWVGPVFLVNRLKNLATRQHHWLRSCETWRPKDTTLRRAFRSLAHHLLAHFPVPGFMDSAWDLAAGPEAFRQQSWFIRLGRGTAVRALNLPLVLTRSMEHYVRQAPEHYTAPQALRYGETRGLGGSEGLAREVALGRLGQRVEHPLFWRTVLNFFVVHHELDLKHVNPIVDFIHAHKFGGEEVVTVDGVRRRAAACPDFSMKGRTLKALLRLVTAWHSCLSVNQPGQLISWKASGIQGYRFLEESPQEEFHRDWIIEELLDSSALHAEGRALRHCVYSYTGRCRQGETTMWSLRLRVDGKEKRMVTVEVDPRRRSIIQARGKCNQRPGARSLEIVRQWAAWVGLQFNC